MKIKHPKIIRILTGLALLFLIPTIPWWASLILIFLAILFFDSYYEALILGSFLDFLYGIPLPIFYNFHFVFFAYASFLLVLSHFAKKRLLLFSLS